MDEDLLANLFPGFGTAQAGAAPTPGTATPATTLADGATPPTVKRFAGVAAEATTTLKEIHAATHLDGIPIKKRGLDGDEEDPFDADRKAAKAAKPAFANVNHSQTRGSCNICASTDGHWASDCPIGVAYTDAKGDKTDPCRVCNRVPIKGERIVKMKVGRHTLKWLHARCAAEQGVLLGLMSPTMFAKTWAQ
jgi:hypothetical protein